jgi:hypothetical protein
MLSVVGVACLLVGGTIFYKVAPKDGEEPAPWLQKDGAAMGVTLLVILFGTFGIGLLIKAFAG